MNQIEGIGNEKMLSILKDPFKKSCIKKIYVTYREKTFSDGWVAEGSVKFSNGKTTGEQDFEGDSFDEVVMKIKNFINEVSS